MTWSLPCLSSLKKVEQTADIRLIVQPYKWDLFFCPLGLRVTIVLLVPGCEIGVGSASPRPLKPPGQT